MKTNLIYGFNKQKMFRSGYIARNTRLKQGERRLDEKNIGGEGSLLAKNKWAKI